MVPSCDRSTLLRHESRATTPVSDDFPSFCNIAKKSRSPRRWNPIHLPATGNSQPSSAGRQTDRARAQLSYSSRKQEVHESKKPHRGTRTAYRCTVPEKHLWENEEPLSEPPNHTKTRFAYRAPEAGRAAQSPLSKTEPFVTESPPPVSFPHLPTKEQKPKPLRSRSNRSKKSPRPSPSQHCTKRFLSPDSQKDDSRYRLPHNSKKRSGRPDN